MGLDDAAQAFREFVATIKALRTPGTGCPWDLEQNHHTLQPFLIEETYEVLEALERGDDPAFRDELGDLLLQVVLHAQIADDRGAFAITEVVQRIKEKMVRRHPHVFGSERVSGSAEVWRNWEQIKAAEKRAEGAEPSGADTLAGIPQGLPALLRAQRLDEKAARAGIDGSSLAEVIAKIQTELAELARQIQGTPTFSEQRRASLEHRLGEILFGLCQCARRLGVNAEDSLRSRTHRFVERLRRMEQQTTLPLHALNAAELQAAWEKAGEREAFLATDETRIQHG